MQYRFDLSGFRHTEPTNLGANFSDASHAGNTLSFNCYYLEKDSRPFVPVSGEFHYSRMDDCYWEDEIIRMRMGGIRIVSTYLFWNHIEEEEDVFDFTGRRDIRRFVTLCKKHGLYVILRIGPFAHGEVRNGGLPDWLYGKPFEVRHTNKGFLQYVRRLYEKIGEQVNGLFFEDDGPIIAIQLDNEYMHSSSVWEMTTGVSNEWVYKGSEGEAYLLELRKIALSSGLRPAFFTATAWGGAACSENILPMWGGYAYWPWIFQSRGGEHPATPGYLYEDYHHGGQTYADDFDPPYDPESRPYACCEMGGGMSCTYNCRFIVDPKSVDAMANIKLGSGCNFIGYYMYHGGTNPLGRHGTFLNESNVPKRSYDYQAPIGEFGQIRESYGRLRAIHAFLDSFGDRLAPLETVLPDKAVRIPRNTNTLRYALRTDGYQGFLFLNNFQDHMILPDRKDDSILLHMGEEDLLIPICLASGENAILPIHFDLDGIHLRTATAQPVLRTYINGRITYVFLVPDGMHASFIFEKNAICKGSPAFFTVRKDSSETDVLILTRTEANQLYRLQDGSLILTEQSLLEDEQGNLRLETTEASNCIRCYPADRLQHIGGKRLADDGIWGVYEVTTPARSIPASCIRTSSHRWIISVPQEALKGLKDARLQIDYCGDIGMLFLRNELISDNFSNGSTWEIGLSAYRDALSTDSLVLNIAPIREGAALDVNSPMAARSETADAEIADLLSVRVQPVYEINMRENKHE